MNERSRRQMGQEGGLRQGGVNQCGKGASEGSTEAVKLFDTKRPLLTSKGGKSGSTQSRPEMGNAKTRRVSRSRYNKARPRGMVSESGGGKSVNANSTGGDGKASHSWKRGVSSVFKTFSISQDSVCRQKRLRPQRRNRRWDGKNSLRTRVCKPGSANNPTRLFEKGALPTSPLSRSASREQPSPS